MTLSQTIDPAAATLAPLPAHAAPAISIGAPRPLRSRIFTLWLYGFSFLFVLAAQPLVLLPSRRPMAAAIRLWARIVRATMRWMLGIRVTATGLENLPRNGAYVLASKHQSEADGILMLALVPDIAFVAMKEVGRYPLVGPLLRKLEMVLVDTDGGQSERKALSLGGRAAADAGRPILIYPEGTLNAVGARGRYRAGVYHLAKDLDLPVVPVATNIGLCWDRRTPTKHAGAASVAILPAMRVGEDKPGFMARLEEVIEAKTAALVSSAIGA
jgi:1-acyl-sn-glycerol-3-phosphate acyltransferase